MLLLLLLFNARSGSLIVFRFRLSRKFLFNHIFLFRFSPMVVFVTECFNCFTLSLGKALIFLVLHTKWNKENWKKKRKTNDAKLIFFWSKTLSTPQIPCLQIITIVCWIIKQIFFFTFHSLNVFERPNKDQFTIRRHG